MNQRIDELMMQSGARLDAWGRVDLDDFQYKKFAELIVKECADHIDDLVTCDDDGNQMLDCDDVRTELLEHFGVEE